MREKLPRRNRPLPLIKRKGKKEPIPSPPSNVGDHTSEGLVDSEKNTTKIIGLGAEVGEKSLGGGNMQLTSECNPSQFVDH